MRFQNVNFLSLLAHAFNLGRRLSGVSEGCTFPRVQTTSSVIWPRLASLKKWLLVLVIDLHDKMRQIQGSKG